MVHPPKELTFRAKQELANLWLLAHPPTPGSGAAQAGSLARLPEPAAIVERLRGTEFAAEVERLAGLILEHRFPLLGATVETGPDIDWRLDYVHNVTSEMS